MAITLDELLGRNTQTVQNPVDRFPSYEEFQSNRAYGATQNRTTQNNMRYNFDVAPASEIRTEDSVRAFEQSRPYVAPRASEYQTQEYAFYDNLRPSRYSNVMPVQQQAQVQPMQAEQTLQMPSMSQPVDYVSYTAPRQSTQNLYEFTANDQERLSEEELYNRLAHTDAAYDAQPAKTGVFARKAQRTQNQTQEKTRGRLNTKGKVILGVYLAVIALVASLIIVNASKINNGKAVAPSSNVQDYATVQMQ